MRLTRYSGGCAILKTIAATLAVVGLAMGAANLYFSLPERPPEPASPGTPAASAGSALTDAVAFLAASHPGRSGVMLLQDGTDAFATRMMLADAAEYRIDAQYYIWHDDVTGALLLDALQRAAERGVRVRLLLDDNGITGLDDKIAALNRHPNVSIRLFNPFVLRNPKWAGFIFDFFRLNRRMHNKSFTVDGAVTVVGGRNIGDEYFGTGTNPLYLDLDLMAIGAVVTDVADDFTRYWRSHAAYPAESIIDPVPGLAPPLPMLTPDSEQDVQAYLDMLDIADIVPRLLAGTLPLAWVPVKLVSDDPVKAQGRASVEQLMFFRLSELVGSPSARLDIVSAYFVPGPRMVAELAELERCGVDVRVFTNSLDATDVAPVHAGYAKYRVRLLRAGVELFELQPESAAEDRRADMGMAGSSSSSLHAKVFVVDGAIVYVGSFNFDPRSMFLNTEMGLVVQSPELAERMHGAFSDNAGRRAYRPLLLDGALIWQERRDGKVIVHSKEPGTTFGQRLAVRVIGWLPVHWLL